MAAIGIDHESVRNALLAGLAECSSDEEVADALAASQGDYAFELDSKTAEYVLVYAEECFGVSLPTPADLGRDQCSTLGVLIDSVLSHADQGAA